jgi:dihydropteroate synthase
MAIINVTPDSFSDGHASINGFRVPEDVKVSLAYSMTASRKALADGADVLDIGGYSTRPGAAFVSVDEEIGRVVPVIEAIRSSVPSSGEEDNAPPIISVDTFRPSVALAALQAGANLVNDVYALSGSSSQEDPFAKNFPTSDTYEMRDILKKYNAPVAMMHSRGEAGKNKDYDAYAEDAAKEGLTAVVKGIKEELGRKVQWAVEGKGGLRRWQVIVDAGVGFSKTVEGNVEILKNISRITADEYDYDLPVGDKVEIPTRRNPLAGFPQLLGHSRKSFLNKITQVELPQDATKTDVVEAERCNKKRDAKELDCASAVVVGLAVREGVEIVRVHDVRGMVDAVKVAGVLYA